jgi:hypothetical protein
MSLPKFFPSSMPMKAAGAFSRPSTISSQYFSEPSRTQPVARVRNSPIRDSTNSFWMNPRTVSDLRRIADMSAVERSGPCGGSVSL